MNKNTPDRAIASKLSHPYEGEEFVPAYASEKLHDLFAYWDSRTNQFHTKHGMKWNRSVVHHIQPTYRHDLVGGFYSPDMSLSELTEAVGVVRDAPGPRAKDVRFYVYGAISPHSFQRRNMELETTAHLGAGVRLHAQHYIISRNQLDAFKRAVISRDGEGVILNRPTSPYGPGGSVKIKFWKDVSFPIVDSFEGVGKFKGKLGAVQVKFGDKLFTVGTMAISESARAQYWAVREMLPIMFAHCKYLHVSNDGIPLNASLQAINHEPL